MLPDVASCACLFPPAACACPAAGAGLPSALSRADLALILLAEIAYENDEDFRSHLPLLFHVAFVSMDSRSALVLEHCQQLLVNLLYSLAGRHLDLYEAAGGDTAGGHKNKVSANTSRTTKTFDKAGIGRSGHG